MINDRIKFLSISYLNSKFLSNYTYKSIKKYFKIFNALGKYRIASFVTLTQVAGYVCATGKDNFDLKRLLFSSAGVYLTASCAAHLNHMFEIKYDSKMLRTKNRPLVLRTCSMRCAMGSCIISGLVGLFCMHYGTSEESTLLALANIILYAFIYTPMKRFSTLNTDLGSIVGAIPPLIGWFSAPEDVDKFKAEALMLPAILFTWQFMHFYPLSTMHIKDYKNAGFKMLCYLRPRLCQALTVMHSFALGAVCLSSQNICEMNPFLNYGLMLPINARGLHLACKFASTGNHPEAKKLFLFSLINLPIILSTFMLNSVLFKNFNKPTGNEILQSHSNFDDDFESSKLEF